LPSKSKNIEDQELGKIQLSKYKNARHIRIRVDTQAVKVSLPYYTRYEEALDFVNEKRSWISQEIQKLKVKKQQLNIFAETKEIIEKKLRRKAHAYLPSRLEELAQEHGLKYKRLAIRNTKTRWGSCSVQNNINLCIHLMNLPEDLIDYVILHELAHTIHKNHSRNFWDFLSSLLAKDAKSVDKRLKHYRPEVSLG